MHFVLKQQGLAPAQADAVAQAAGEAFAAYPHWLTSSRQEQEVRRALYKGLLGAGVDGVVDVAQHLLKMLRRATE